MKEQHMSKTPIPFTGGCVCGAVRYELTAEPILTLKCHCRDCQHITGSGFAPAFLVPAEAFRLTRGQLRYHLTQVSGAENINAVFVPNVVHELRAVNLKQENRRSWEF